MVPRKPSNKRKLLQLPYPENLLMKLLEGIVESIDVTADRQAGLDYALSKLTEVEQEVLRFRFQERLTYAEIGKVRGKSDHSACGTENNAMRKLRQTSLRGYIVFGKEGFETMDCVYPSPGTPSTKTEDPDPKVLLLPFEELDLSIGAFNILRRAGYETVRDILYLTSEQIMKIKGFSRKRSAEIAAKLRSLGLRNTAWNEYL